MDLERNRRLPLINLRYLRHLRLPLICVVCGVMRISGAAQAPAPQPKAQFEARADVVLIDVTVVSSNGEPVSGLTAADFQLTVNGQPRQVHTAQFISTVGKPAAEIPRLASVSRNDVDTSGRLLLFVIDENHLTSAGARAVLRTAERAMSSLSPGDPVGLVRLPMGRGSVEFTTDRSRIRRALTGVTGLQPQRKTEQIRVSEAAALDRREFHLWEQVVNRECGAPTGGITDSGVREACINDLEAQAQLVIADATARSRMSVAAFEQLSARLANMRVPVNLILISEGLFVGRDRQDLSRLARLAAEARVTFFVVQPQESVLDLGTPTIRGSMTDDDVLAEGLHELAGLTRGSYFKAETNGAAIFDRISRELSAYYLLSFEPTEADRTSRDRKIKVELRRRGVTVRARSTYALAEVSGVAAAAPEEQIKNLLAAPLPTPGLPMRVATYSVANAQDARIRVIISAEIGQAATDAAAWPVGILVANKEGQIVADTTNTTKLEPATDRTPSPRLLLTSIVLDPGEYILRLAAVGPDGVAGSVHHTIDARLRPMERDISVSDLMLSSAMPAGGMPRPTPSAVIYSETLAATLELASSDNKQLGAAYVDFQINEPSATTALVTTQAQSVPRGEGQRGFVGLIDLSVLPPGEYIARAVVHVPGQKDNEISRPFRLAPIAVATDASPVAARLANDEAPAPLPVTRIVLPVTRFAVEDVLKPEVVRSFLDDLQQSHPSTRVIAPVVEMARGGKFLMTEPDARASPDDEVTLAFIRGLAQLEKKQYAPAAAWFQIALKNASDFLGAAFYLGAVHAATGRDKDAVGAWQLALTGGGETVYPLLVDAMLRVGDAQGALDMIAEAPDAFRSADARMRRVATAQAMLGQFEPALESLDGLIRLRPEDRDLLFMALQILYRQHLTRALPQAERARFDDYSRRYIALKGPDVALVETWRKYVQR